MNKQLNNPRSNGNYILFYSTKCQTSQNLITLLHNEGILSRFKMLSLEKDGRLFPKEIQIVPTLIVAEIPKPLVAEAAFKWLQGIKFMKQRQAIDNNKKLAHLNNLKNAQQDNTSPNSLTNEMVGFSDEYAYYVSDEHINKGQKDIDNAQPKAFFSCGDEEKNAIFTHTEMPKMTQKEQNERIAYAENTRKQQESSFKEIMKNGQLNEVIKYEQDKLINRNRK